MLFGINDSLDDKRPTLMLVDKAIHSIFESEGRIVEQASSAHNQQLGYLCPGMQRESLIRKAWDPLTTLFSRCVCRRMLSADLKAMGPLPISLPTC